MAIADRYEIDEAMGEGGFSRVYRGQERATGRAVALKVLKSAFYENAEVRERFQREVFAVASLSNPHIVGMYDFDLNSEDLYIAMEYVAGHTLRERMCDRFSIKQRFSILAQIADAVAAAHDRNVVHRDLKPENVKIVEHEQGKLEVKVLDFGMAKLSELESQLELKPLTKVGICFGTPQYMSPEQIRGKLDDSSIDLYALAIIAYELLAGERPWDGADPYEVMRAVLQQPAPPIKQMGSFEDDEQIEPARLHALNMFFSRALAKPRAQRPVDARQFIADLEQALFGDMRAPQESAPIEHLRAARRDDTIPVQSLDEDSLSSLSELATRADTNPASLPGVASFDSGPQSYSQADSAPPTIADGRPRAADGRMRRDETVTDAHAASGALRAYTDGSYAPEPVNNDSLVAARAALAMSRKERTWRSFIVPLIVLAALGGSVGYLLAGSASAQSNEIHDFIVGKHK